MQGSAGDAGAVEALWQQVEEGTRSSISVRSAAVCALCACGRLEAAAAALQELLSLYAVAYGSDGDPSARGSAQRSAPHDSQGKQAICASAPQKCNSRS